MISALALVAGLLATHQPAFAAVRAPHYTTAELCAVLLPCLPPARYTHGAFIEPPTIERVSLATIQQACSTGENIVLDPAAKQTPRIQQALGSFGGGVSIMGCALITPTSCIVHVPIDVEKVIPQLYDIVVEHELGHCRGWVHPRY